MHVHRDYHDVVSDEADEAEELGHPVPVDRFNHDLEDDNMNNERKGYARFKPMRVNFSSCIYRSI